MKTCVMCRKILSDEKDEDVGAESPTGAAICLGCAAEVIVTGYQQGFRLPYLEESIPQLFEISSETEKEILQQKGMEIAEKYQSRLLAVRDPDPTPDESKRTSISVTVTSYTKKRIEALSAECGLNVSEWIRHAIWLAFESTKAS